MKRESLNTSIPSHHFQSGGGMLNHIGGTYSHNGMMDYPRSPIAELHLGKIHDSVNFKAVGLRFVQEQQILRSSCTGSKKLR